MLMMLIIVRVSFVDMVFVVLWIRWCDCEVVVRYVVLDGKVVMKKCGLCWLVLVWCSLGKGVVDNIIDNGVILKDVN